MVGLGYADTVMRACIASDCHDIKGVTSTRPKLDEIDSECFRTPLVLAPIGS
jgi:hypothetical protein